MGSITELHNLGQSLWYDNIQRRLIENGELEALIQAGEIKGVTSNPTIFNNAISKSIDYDTALKPLAWSGWKAEDIFWQLAVEDIQAAADLFLPLYQQSKGMDGYVSLEVSPLIANDTAATVEAAKVLWERVNKPNLMIKIPATKAGIPAIRQTIAAGINVNVTLIFSLERYEAVMEAYLSGLEDRVGKSLPIDSIASVASFFVSRVDTKVDGMLKEMILGNPAIKSDLLPLFGKAAIANAKMAYSLFLRTFQTDRFKQLEKKGARKQRPLWASTSTKNPEYRDVIYVEELIGDHTVNTLPPATLDAFRDHGIASITIDKEPAKVEKTFQYLENVGISMQKVSTELEEEGVNSFADAFGSLLNSIETRRTKAVKELGPLGKNVLEIIENLENQDVINRLHNHDASLWVEDVKAQEEIKQRLGWLIAPTEGKKHLKQYEELRDSCLKKGIRKALVLGMGGSSLAPEVFSLVFSNAQENKAHSLELSVLDSTDPDQVSVAVDKFPPGDTLYILSSKSGSTAEVNAFFRYFWSLSENQLGRDAGDHFVAITDPGTSLEKLAKEHHFTNIFYGDPTVGGRFSALTAFGLVPATLAGVDVERLLNRAEIMKGQCLQGIPYSRNPGLLLGSLIGYWADHGRDKLTLLSDSEISSFGSWLEQLIAESTGKQGKGILPIVNEPLVDAHDYGDDRVFVYLRISGSLDGFSDNLIMAGQPVIILPLVDLYDLGSEIFRWEMAVSLACVSMKINPFDQPDVQFNKSLTQQMITDYENTQSLIEDAPIWNNDHFKILGKKWSGFSEYKNITEVLESFISEARKGDYIAINSFIPRTSKNEEILAKLREKLLLETKIPTTLGFGPRFLHSTGQLHKGGANTGIFIEITQDPQKDINIPGENMTFGILERAQALGDFKALQERGRRIIRIHAVTSHLDEITLS